MTAPVPARLHQPSRQPEGDGDVGWCGNKLWPTPVQSETPIVCKLPAAHAGWHRDGDCNWGIPETSLSQEGEA